MWPICSGNDFVLCKMLNLSRFEKNKELTCNIQPDFLYDGINQVQTKRGQNVSVLPSDYTSPLDDWLILLLNASFCRMTDYSGPHAPNFTIRSSFSLQW